MASTYLLSCDITEVYWWLECKRAALHALSKSKYVTHDVNIPAWNLAR